jgi:hypothetical protein
MLLNEDMTLVGSKQRICDQTLSSCGMIAENERELFSISLVSHLYFEYPELCIFQHLPNLERNKKRLT